MVCIRRNKWTYAERAPHAIFGGMPRIWLRPSLSFRRGAGGDICSCAAVLML